MLEKDLEEELGLTKNEARIYLLLSKEGSLTIQDISSKLGLHRGYCYDALKRMQNKQAVSIIKKNGKQFFQAVNPESLLELLKMKADRFSKLIPSFELLGKTGGKKTDIQVYTGERIFRTLTKDLAATVKKREEYYLFGIDEELLTQKIEPIYVKQYVNALKIKKAREKIIIKKGGMKLKSAYLEYRELPSEYFNENAGYLVYSNKVAFFVFGNPHSLVIIESKDFADSMKRQFQLMWKIAK